MTDPNHCPDAHRAKYPETARLENPQVRAVSEADDRRME